MYRARCGRRRRLRSAHGAAAALALAQRDWQLHRPAADKRAPGRRRAFQAIPMRRLMPTHEGASHRQLR
eukprot:9681813-Ditylum_brightwellii.AAC.1